MKFLLFFVIVVISTSTASFWRLAPPFDFEAYYAELEAEEAAKEAATLHRERRSDDISLRMCERTLMEHFAQQGWCDCEGASEKSSDALDFKRFHSRAKRSRVLQEISNICCSKYCRALESVLYAVDESEAHL